MQAAPVPQRQMQVGMLITLCLRSNGAQRHSHSPKHRVAFPLLTNVSLMSSEVLSNSGFGAAELTDGVRE